MPYAEHPLEISLVFFLPPFSFISTFNSLTRAKVTAPDGEKMNSVIKVERKLGLKAAAAAGGGGKGRAPPPQQKQSKKKKKKTRPFYHDSSSSSSADDDDDKSESEDEAGEGRHTLGVVELADDETDDETDDEARGDNKYLGGDGGGGGGSDGEGCSGEEAARSPLGRSPSGSRPCAAALPTNVHPTTNLARGEALARPRPGPSCQQFLPCSLVITPTLSASPPMCSLVITPTLSASAMCSLVIIPTASE